ncbi:MAG: hypothetical protein Q8L60_11810 [Gammaproteobacteria bacterium]|nr:hypothetical protein [Gammaproteobacteria bacterium]MDP2139250.1 hypothetical protein [Gammaproteobacteria bacterium]MDP2348981.1 hypothetical protein [Gammaproteobacteria bacterium]
MLNELIAAYGSRLQSYEFLLARLEQEMAFAQNSDFLRFCECEAKRLQDLIQLCQQILTDLNALEHSLANNENRERAGKNPGEEEPPSPG